MVLFEGMTFEYILKRALSMVKSKVDKRQGSVIWDALAPACAELAKLYIQLDHILKITFAETSFGQWLDKRCAEMGVYREPATKSVRLGLFYGRDNQPFNPPIGSRFNIEQLNYTVIEKIGTGQFRLECQECGIIGNQLFGRIIPIETIRGLTYGELADVLIPGEDQETDEVLYRRYVETVNATPYGGNIADYKRKTKAFEGVGDCKVFPVWNGGGTVKVCVITTEHAAPSDTLVSDVQELLDPVPYHQMGLGLAPIGHYVTVTGVKAVAFNISAKLVLQQHITMGQVQEDIQEALKEYLHDLAKSWASEERLIVRISQIESRILNVSGILDVMDTKINKDTKNITLNEEEIPVLGEVRLSE